MNPVPIPLSDPIARPPRKEYVERKQRDPQEGQITQPWVDYFTDQGQTQTLAPTRQATVELTGQSASIGATDLTGGTFSAGLYRVTYYARVTQAATTSSSLTVTLDWNEGGVTPSFSGAAMTGNTTTTVQSETQLVEIANLSAIRYSTTYASVGFTVMLYKLSVVVEQVSA
jgi:hypothetical protein